MYQPADYLCGDSLLFEFNPEVCTIYEYVYLRTCRCIVPRCIVRRCILRRCIVRTCIIHNILHTVNPNTLVDKIL